MVHYDQRNGPLGYFSVSWSANWFATYAQPSSQVVFPGSMQEEPRLDPTQLAQIIADVAIDKKALDVVTLDIHEQSVIADYFVICTGTNPRQIQAIAGAIEDKLAELNTPTRGFEGAADTGWMLLDCGDVIVHIFGPMEREFYRLERLWSSAPSVVYVE
ncbi:MAG TPA: ribosome silencing factor [Ktedonobacterales bacterium]|nr:ribosome silencing factor [Ktedonobacterales bacterium]